MKFFVTVVALMATMVAAKGPKREPEFTSCKQCDDQFRECHKLSPTCIIDPPHCDRACKQEVCSVKFCREHCGYKCPY
ncbi:hypothetical protein ACN47E_007215 [Coniothyrium glycines]